MKRILTTSFFLMSILCAISNVAKAQKTMLPDSLTEVFPASWVGEWKGEVKIYNAKGVKQEVPMQLHVRPLDSLNHYDLGGG